MKKSDFAGWREVFEFTFSQTVKQKAYGIFLVIFSVIALLNSTVSTLFKQYEGQKETKSVISQVIVFDETGLQIDYNNVFTSKKYKNVVVVSNPSKSMEEYEKQMEEQADETMLIKISFNEDKEEYHVLFVQGKKVNLSEIARLEFADEFCDYFETARMDAVNISDKQRELIQTDIIKEIKQLSEEGDVVDKAKGDSISYNDYFVILALLMVSMMLINISSNQIALSIVTEKSSRVLEYLVLNVRPLALIVGKLLATIVTSSLQMIAVGFCYVASPILSNLITPHLSRWLLGIVETAETNTTVADETLALSVQMIHSLKIEYIFLAIIYVVLGIILYGIIAGLLSASVSKMDEMQEAMSLFQILLVVGCYADMALCVMQITGVSNPIFSKILSICPVTSPFLVPANMLLGKMSPALILLSFLVMLLSIAVLFILTASVYEALIFYNGKALKMKDIIALASSRRKSAKKEVSKHEE